MSEERKEKIRRFGWRAIEDDPGQETLYKQALGDAWLDIHADLVRAFGGSGANPYFCIDAVDAACGLKYKDRMESFLGVACCPLGSANYLSSDGNFIWGDSRSRFYVQDSEGFIFIAEGDDDFVRVAILSGEKSKPPPDLVDILERACHWDSPEESKA